MLKNYFLRYWYKWVGEPSSAKAVKHMQRSLAKLDHANQFQAAKANALEHAAAAAKRAAALATNEAAKAGRVRDKLKELFEV